LAHDAAARDDIVEAVPDRTVVSAKHLVGEGDCADPHTVAPGVHQSRQHARTTAVRVDVDGGGWMPAADLPCRVDQRVVACQWLAFAALPEGDDAGVFTAQVMVGHLYQLRRRGCKTHARLWRRCRTVR